MQGLDHGQIAGGAQVGIGKIFGYQLMNEGSKDINFTQHWVGVLLFRDDDKHPAWLQLVQPSGSDQESNQTLSVASNC